MQTNEIIEGLQTTKDLPTFLLQHVATLDHLYKPTDEYVSLLEALRETVGTFYFNTCPILKDCPDIVTKEWLNQNRDAWEVSGYRFFNNTTSGTTSERFKYRIHNDVYYRLELFEHYIAILREFFVVPKQLVYFICDSYSFTDTQFTQKVTTDNAVMTHGLREAVEVLQIFKNATYFDDHYKYYDEVFKVLENNPTDLILADGSSISEMIAWIKRTGYRKKFCKLLSTTSCGVVDKDLEFLRANKLIDNWCDHMRCWDGGITFFSCEFNVRHVVEHFSYPMSIDNKLVSQDFFSFPNPFWNYWNGDFVVLDDEYKRCECGRIYRDFGIKREREHNINGVYTFDMEDSLVDVDCLKRSCIYGNLIKVYTDRPLTTNERQRVRSIMPNMHYRFVVE